MYGYASFLLNEALSSEILRNLQKSIACFNARQSNPLIVIGAIPLSGMRPLEPLRLPTLFEWEGAEVLPGVCNTS